MTKPSRKLLLAALAVVACWPTATASAANDGGLLSMLVMGDSYSAGNGAGAYYGAKGCRRSANNYARRYARLLEQPPYRQRTFVENVACSGDTTDHFFQSRKGRPPQLNAVNGGYDVVFLTTGGNDLGFGQIVRKCLIQMTRDGADCGRLLTSAERQLRNGSLERDIAKVLRAIRTRADGRARIVLLGYPHLEGDPAYRLRSGHFGNTFIEVGKRLSRLTNAGDRIQAQTVRRLNRERPRPNFTFVSTKRLFAGPPDHSLFAQRTNPRRWFIQPLVDVANIDYDLFYHPNPTGWAKEAARLLRVHGVPKRDLNSDVFAPTGGPPLTHGPPGVDRVTALSPTVGPVGFAPGVTGPACRPRGGEVALLRLRVGDTWSLDIQVSVLQDPGWRIALPLPGVAAGSHRLAFRCISAGDSGEHLVWDDSGFDITLTGSPRPVTVGASTVRAGEEVSVVSGASQGSDPCPALQGATMDTLSLFLTHGADELAEASLPLPTLTASEPLYVPEDTPVGATLMAQAICLYLYPNTAFAGFHFAPTEVFVTP